MIEVGKTNNMRVVKEVDFGVYLDGENYGEILLPKRYVPEGCQVDDVIEVFLYLDSEDWLIATTETPHAMVGQFAYLKAIAVNRVGAFLDWGLMKDLMVPYREQRQKMVEGQYYLVYVYYDRKSERICASSKLDKFMSDQPIYLKAGDEVDLIIADQTDLGYKAIVNDDFWGLLFKNEVFQPIKKGQKIKGYVKRVRNDERIDLCLQKPGYAKIGGLAGEVLEYVKQKGGFVPLSAKSSPEEIYNIFKTSKKNFKMAIGNLYKQRLITIEDDGIRVVNS